MSCERPIILGGAGSSGSTLLITILNRHKKIAAGPELSLFNKRAFFNMPFEELKAQRKKIINRGMCTDGWFLYPRIYFEKYGFSASAFSDLIKASTDQKDFIDRFFSVYLDNAGKTLWAEKTPSNVYCFREFMHLYPEARFIHIYRDGRDVVTSFIKRGMRPYFATMLWLYNTSQALNYRNLPNYYEIRYEDLVKDPAYEIKRLCDFLELKYDAQMLYAKENEKVEVASWNHSPNAGIDSSSVGKYKSYLTGFHYYTMLHTRISKRHIRQYQLEYINAEEIQKALGYGSLMDNQKYPTKWIVRLGYSLRLFYSLIRDMIYRYYILVKKGSRIPAYPGKITTGMQRSR